MREIWSSKFCISLAHLTSLVMKEVQQRCACSSIRAREPFAHDSTECVKTHESVRPLQRWRKCRTVSVQNCSGAEDIAEQAALRTAEHWLPEIARGLYGYGHLREVWSRL